MFTKAELVVETRLEELRELFSGCKDALFLRGSYARGDRYCNDIDISAYNESGAIQMVNPPREFQGLKINYGGISTREIEDYFSVCPRGGSAIMEMQPITVAHSVTPNILNQQGRQYFAHRIPDYLLFLLVEEETNGRIADRSHASDYFALKRHRGSKRTISRIIWGTKARHYDSLRFRSHEEVIDKMVALGDMPQSIAESCVFVLRRAHLRPKSDVWVAHTAAINHWYYKTYAPSVVQYLKEHVPLETIEYTLKAARADTTTFDLQHAYELSHNLVGQQRWIMLFALSGNWNLPPEYLIKIWEEFRYMESYRNIIRNLIANISMPDELIKPTEFDGNKLMLRAYNIRQYLKSGPMK